MVAFFSFEVFVSVIVVETFCAQQFANISILLVCFANSGPC